MMFLIKCIKHLFTDLCNHTICFISALEEKGLFANDITHVVCTHGHSDHVGNLNLFVNALHIVGQSVSQKDHYFLHSFEEVSYQ